MNKEVSESGLRWKHPPIAFLICLLISAMIWVFMNFSKTYTQSLSYQVVCTDLPAEYEKVSTSDSILNITIKASGFDFLGYNFKNKNRVVQLSVKQLIDKKGKRRAYSLTKKELGEYFRENNIIPYSFVEIEKPETLTIYLKH